MLQARMPPTATPPKRDRSYRHSLQRLLGDLGTVLPRQVNGTPQRLAAGWYAELADGKVVFLGDNSMIAAVQISRLHAGT
jgi:hypothetical protein